MNSMPEDRSQCRSLPGPRQLVEPVDPELLQSLAVLAVQRLALAQTVQALAG